MGLVRSTDSCYVSDSEDATKQFGKIVAECVAGGDVIVLTGGLGTGKTQIAKGVSEGLGDPRPVTSPTFSLMAVHDGGRIPLFHFDLYRIEHAYQLEDTGIYDVLGYEGVCLIEWGEQFQDQLTDEYLTIHISRLDETDENSGRVILLEPHGMRAEQLVNAIDDAVVRALGE